MIKTGHEEGAAVLRGAHVLYVPVSPTSLGSLDEALGKKGYGQVAADDFKPVFVQGNATIGGRLYTGAIAYTRLDLMPSKQAYMPMSVTQLLTALVADPKVVGIVLDPGSSRAAGIDKHTAQSLLAALPAQPPEPMQILIK